MLTVCNLGRVGRFGNQLFQIAGVIGIATMNGYNYGFEPWKNYDHKHVFGAEDDINVQDWFENPLPFLDDVTRFPQWNIPWGYYPPMMVPDNVSIFGHMQSDRYFNHCIELIRGYFTMKNEPAQNDFVAIHYRAGDYEADYDGYHPRQPIEYYKSGMAHFSQHQRYIVFSDDMLEARRMFAGINAEFASGNYLEDFRLMKRCKSFIIANSTFSLMAAILGTHPEKKIICPRRWFGPIAGITGDDCYPEGSIVI